MHCFKKSSSECDVIVDFGVNYEDVNKTSSLDACDKTKGCFSKLHSNLVYAKAINKGVELKCHSTDLNIKEIYLPKCVCYVTMFHLKNEATFDYDP